MPWVGWLLTITLFLCLVAMIVKWGTARHPPQLIVGWAQNAWAFFVGPQGYLVIISLIGLYAAVYGGLIGQHLSDPPS
jgi:Na+/proline symporter